MTAVPACEPAPVKVFVAATGNQFMDDIAGWLVEAAVQCGRQAELVNHRLPQLDGSINLVVAPHEFYELFDAPRHELQSAAALSIPVCTEQPGTPWFHLAVDACRRAPITIDINPHGVGAFVALGLDAVHLRLGSTPSISAAAIGGAPRPIDALFMGGLDDRRGRILAQLAPALYQRQADLRLFRFERPSRAGSPGLVFGQDKYAVLASAKLLINLHRDRSAHHLPGQEPVPYFEWARMIEAMANGCVVVTEPSDGAAPLVAGTHFVECDHADLGRTIDELLSDPARIDAIADAAHDMVTGPLALCLALGPLLDRIESEVLPELGRYVVDTDPTRGLWRLGASKVIPPTRLGAFRPYLGLQRQAKEIALAENRSLQRLDAASCMLAHGTEQHVVRIESPAFASAIPEISVIVSVYNYAFVVAETLESIAASEQVAFEIIVVDDHATDDSREVVRAFIETHAQVPIVLLGKDANEGLASARNTGFAAARAGLVMVMDADNHLYPTCLRRLADALAADPDAAAAYAILEDFGVQQNIRSSLAWDPERMCRANYIDAQAMWRRSAWERLGGYRDDDDHVYGWEDWDLWLRLAEAGGHATLVAQILGRYRTQTSSMISLTNLATDDAINAIRARYPALPWGPLVR